MEFMSKMELTTLFGFLIILMAVTVNGRPRSETGSAVVSAEDPSLSEEARHQECRSQLTSKIDMCLMRFEQLYILHQHPEAGTMDGRAMLTRRMCQEYEETLHCLHLVLLSCPPDLPHLNLIEYRIGSVEMRSFIQRTCNNPNPSTETTDTTISTPSTTTTTTTTNQEPTTSTITTSTLAKEEVAARETKLRSVAPPEQDNNGTPNFTLDQEDGYIKLEIEEPQESAASSRREQLDCTKSIHRNDPRCQESLQSASSTSRVSLLLALCGFFIASLIVL